MVRIKSKPVIKPNQYGELISYWFGYLKSRARMLRNNSRIRCRVPIGDIGHLFKMAKDLGIIKIPTKINDGFGQYAQIIMDNKNLCNSLISLGWNSQPSSKLDSRHVLRGMLDGSGSICRNGRGIQSKYKRVVFFSKEYQILEWIMNRLGRKKVCNFHIGWTGSAADKILRLLYLDQTVCLKRRLISTGLFNMTNKVGEV